MKKNVVFNLPLMLWIEGIRMAIGVISHWYKKIVIM